MPTSDEARRAEWLALMQRAYRLRDELRVDKQVRDFDRKSKAGRFHEAKSIADFRESLRNYVEALDILWTVLPHAKQLPSAAVPDFDKEYTCRLAREVAVSLGLPDAPPVPDGALDWRRARLYLLLVAAHRESGASAGAPDDADRAALEADDDPFRPAAYFQTFDRNLPDRLRHATKPGRKSKGVRWKMSSGVKLYSERDTRLWWPHSFEGRDEKRARQK